MLLLGIDVGTSSVKVSVIDAATTKIIASAQFPETEAAIISKQPGWAEQDPETWWSYTKQAIKKVNSSGKYNPDDIVSVGIAYQMHGLVVIDKNKHALRPSIIWCDSRAVEIGNTAFNKLGADYCLGCLLNSPGNFTASKLSWVKQNEPEVYEKIDKIMLPGDFIALKLTGEISTSPSALSEGIFWDFTSDDIADKIVSYYGFERSFIPSVQPVFSVHGKVTNEIAKELALKPGIPVAYKAGDQPNNALSLNVMKPGEIAATAGTSGVIYAVSDKLTYDLQSRVNSFAHVNHNNTAKSIGVLLCINGTGIMNRWIKDNMGKDLSYNDINRQAQAIALGSDGLTILPFGNGAERMLENKMPGAQISNLQLTVHTSAHLFRAVQEGIACAFKYGLDILKQNGIHPTVIRAGKANMFLSKLFTDLFVNFTGVPVELYENDGAAGAAIGGGIGAGIYKTTQEAFASYAPVSTTEPGEAPAVYNEIYQRWKAYLEKSLD
ncbi:carbohydrate kinase [Terrimonas sp.]|uniref:xylulokinase n=1 Tax=Terrimonas sp. TaxID=1914338 RepID=UPI000D50A6D1|nr:FGGY family carbohydrate kinase [Terrimonas sp.]PVD54038.1 carbohydrate kinase [Terrimonas sp.]